MLSPGLDGFLVRHEEEEDICEWMEITYFMKIRDKKSERFDLRRKLRRIETFVDKDGIERTAAKEFLKPWDGFTKNVKDALQKIIVSFN